MVRMIYCVMRKDGVSVKAFREYFVSAHKDKICAVAKRLKAKKFSQSLALMVEEGFLLMARRGTAAPYDGINEIWWDSARDFSDNVNAAEIESILEQFFAGEEQFIDLHQSRIFFTEQPQDCSEEEL